MREEYYIIIILKLIVKCKCVVYTLIPRVIIRGLIIVLTIILYIGKISGRKTRKILSCVRSLICLVQSKIFILIISHSASASVPFYILILNVKV